jgi:hypothetical protein
MFERAATPFHNRYIISWRCHVLVMVSDPAGLRYSGFQPENSGLAPPGFRDGPQTGMIRSMGDKESPRRCVYTALTGRYEKLNEQPIARESSIPFICLTDDPALVSETWQIRPIVSAFGMDPIRNQRRYKLFPHRVLPEFGASLYIDNSVVLSATPERVFDAADLASGLCLPEHSFRDTVLDEFAAVSAQNLDDPDRIFDQLNRYDIEFPEILSRRPYWSGIMLRDHTNQTTIAAMEIWMAHIHRYSRRDQLSSLAAFHLAGLHPGVLRIDNHRSWFHTWPHATERKIERRAWRPVAAEAVPLPEPNGSHAEFDRKHAAILALTSWRVMADLTRERDAAREEALRTADELTATQADLARERTMAWDAAERAAAALAATQAELAREHEAAQGLAERAAAAQTDAEAVRRERDVIVQSTTWRALAPLRQLGRRHPRIALALRRAVKLAWWTTTGQPGGRYRLWRRPHG